MDDTDVRHGHILRARRLIALLDPSLEQMRTGSASAALQDLLQLVARSAVVRQNEALAHALRAAEDEVARSVAGLVRPAVEERVTLSYLHTIDRRDANNYLRIKVQLDAYEGLDAQRRIFDGSLDVVGSNHPTPAADKGDLTSAMVELARRHDWPIAGKRDRAKSHGPKMRWMAERCGEEDLYDYLYGAASRTVHFSPTELLRRCWFDKDDRLNIGGHSMEKWWTSFSVGWGCILLGETLKVAIEIGAPVPISTPPLDELTELIEECRSHIPPLVTLSELSLDPGQR